MTNIPEDYFEKVYAGWLGKIIGIRLGANIEGWTYEKIRQVFGELYDYPVEFHDFAADDDSNGPLFLIRSLEDCGDIHEISAQDVGEALLNYAPYEHGFFWWGGYGISTEHTAYLNLRNGIPAPRSGSVKQNGSTVAEQIGGQIFIDSWGFVTPGNPDLAATLAAKAASVTHGGNGVWGGVFIAVCISMAFIEKDIKKIIRKALTYIPNDCEYARVVCAVMEYYSAHPKDWRACFGYIYENFGYDKYPGGCHIIPNTAVIILALLYGEGEFENSICICNMCGWDTDCNVANVGSIMGVRNGLAGINYEKWGKPVHDFLACSSVIGSLNAVDIPYGASYFAKMAYLLAGEELPEPWKTIIETRIDSCHFEYPQSTHSIQFRGNGDYALVNTDETAFTGKRSLKMTVFLLNSGERACFYKKTYYTSADFSDSRYDPAFSPLVYPGQTLHAAVMLPEDMQNCRVQLYAKEGHSGEMLLGEQIYGTFGRWESLSFEIPPMKDGRIDEVGVVCTALPDQGTRTVTIYLDDLYVDGNPSYGIDFIKEKEDVWPGIHKEISQFTKVKGLFSLEESRLIASCSDFAEAYTGHYNWEDYTFTAKVTPLMGEHHYLNFRVQGAIRSYAAGFCGEGKLALLKNQNGYTTLCSVPFAWEQGKTYSLTVCVKHNRITVSCEGKKYMEFEDLENPYKKGSIGVSVHYGSRCGYSHFMIES